MRRYSVFLLVLLAGAVPETARAACGPAARAFYETPEVHVALRGERVVACHRATNRTWRVGVRTRDEASFVNGVLGGRWLWMSMLGTYAGSADVQVDSLADLRTGRVVRVTVQDEDTNAPVAALPGALVAAGNRGVFALFTSGRAQRLSSDPGARAVAVSGSRVYWRVGDVAHTAVLKLPRADAPARRPLARRAGRCAPRSGARLLVRDASMVVTRTRDATWVCRRGVTRKVGDANVQAVSLLDHRLLAYARPGAVGVVDVASGRWRELPSGGGPIAASIRAFAAAGPEGVRAWRHFRTAPGVLAPGRARAVAIGADGDATLAYWLDSAGGPRVAVL